jgi:hypothetical protein
LQAAEAVQAAHILVAAVVQVDYFIHHLKVYLEVIR